MKKAEKMVKPITRRDACSEYSIPAKQTLKVDVTDTVSKGHSPQNESFINRKHLNRKKELIRREFSRVAGG